MTKDADVVVDADNIQFGQNNEVLSHSALVMTAYQKVINVLVKEKREGFWEHKTDKFGNQISVYFPDARKETIEAIKTLKDVMINDLQGTEYLKEIEKLEKELDEKLDYFIECHNKWFNSLVNVDKKKYQMVGYAPNRLHSKSSLYQEYMVWAVDVYRDIFQQLELCLATKKYLKKDASKN